MTVEFFLKMLGLTFVLQAVTLLIDLAIKLLHGVTSTPLYGGSLLLPNEFWKAVVLIVLAVYCVTSVQRIERKINVSHGSIIGDSSPKLFQLFIILSGIWLVSTHLSSFINHLEPYMYWVASPDGHSFFSSQSVTKANALSRAYVNGLFVSSACVALGIGVAVFSDQISKLILSNKK